MGRSSPTVLQKQNLQQKSQRKQHGVKYNSEALLQNVRECSLSVANVLERSLHVLRIFGLSPLCLVEREEFLSLRSRALLELGRRAAVNNVVLEL